MANEKFLTYPHILLQVGIYARAHAYSDTSRGKRKSEDDFDFKSTDFQPQNDYTTGTHYLKHPSILVWEILSELYS